jgi:hypothetical protein
MTYTDPENLIQKKGFSITETSYNLIIDKKWNILLGVICTFFGIIWLLVNGFINYECFVNIEFSETNQFLFYIQIIFFTLPIIFLILGTFIIYFGIAILVNKTKIIAESDTLTIQHGPMPLFFNNISVHKSNIKQIYFKDFHINKRTNSKTLYRLEFINSKGQSISFLGKILGFDVLWFERLEAEEIESKLEKYFNIKDEAVAGAQNNKNSAEEIIDTEKTNHEGLLPVPETLIIEEKNNELFIFKSWRTFMVIFQIFFAIIWNTIVFSFFGIAIWGMFMVSSDLIYLLIFSLPFVGVGIWIILTILAKIFNKTTIYLNSDVLTVENKPVKIFKNYKFKTADITKITVEERIRYERRAQYIYYVIILHFKNSKPVVLFKNFRFSLSHDESFFIQQKIARVLKLENLNN